MLGTPWLRSRSSYQFSLTTRSRIRSGSHHLIVPAFTRCSTHASIFDRRRSGSFGKIDSREIVSQRLGRFAECRTSNRTFVLADADDKGRGFAPRHGVGRPPSRFGWSPVTTFLSLHGSIDARRDVARCRGMAQGKRRRPVGRPSRVGYSKQWLHQLWRHPTSGVLLPLSITRTG